MKQFILFYIVVLFLNSVFITSSIALAKNSNSGLDSLYVVPNAYTTSPGTAAFTGPLASAQRTYQLLIHSDQLTGLVNQLLNGLTWRIPISSTANWPLIAASFTNYDIYLSESVLPQDRSLTFANNIVGNQKKVRSGSLVIPIETYTFGDTPNAFGGIITFDSTYLYTGGNLLVEIRHSGFTGGAISRSNDAVGVAITGYGTQFSACWVGNFTGTTGSQGNFTVVQFSSIALPVELISFTASVNSNNVDLKWTTSSEINNSGFDLERKLYSAADWVKIKNIQGAGNSNNLNHYSCTDKNLSTGKYQYRLKQIDYNGNFEYFNLSSEVIIGSPEKYSLSQNYPNPFNPSTTINFDLPVDSKVTLKVYDLLGREVYSVFNNELIAAGFHNTQLNLSSLTSGTYFYRIIAIGLNGQEFITTKKMQLVK